jgi:hypothetical protein
MDFINASDIKVKLETYTLLFYEIKEQNSKTIILCINNICDVIKDIENELRIIETNKNYNESLYVAKTLRSYSFKINIDRLKVLTKLLDDRMIIFRNICDIVSFVGIKGNSELKHDFEIETNEDDQRSRSNVHVNYYGCNNLKELELFRIK